MKTALCLIPILVTVLCSCTSVATPAVVPSPFAETVNIKELMEWVIDPTVDVIWDSVKYIETAEGTKEIAPRTPQEWEAVRNAAAALAESSNLLMIQQRAREGKEWLAAATSLRIAATGAMQAAQEKDQKRLFDAGGNIYNACSACHFSYAQHLRN